MKDLLLTTALISLIAAAPIGAQTTTDNATDGSTATDTGNMTDTGNTTGGDTSTDTGSTTGTGTGMNTETSTTTDTTAGTSTDMGTTAAITPPEGYTAFETATLTVDDLQGATIYDANGESVGSISDVVMASTTTGSSTTESADAGATDTTGTGTDATGDAIADPGPTASTDGTAAGDSGTEVTMDGQVSHVILDVGGFLGIGAHTVAVPVDALQVFRDANNEMRVYLPWTQAQLEALPEYDENDPATLGTTTGGASGDMGTDASGGMSTDNSTSTDSGTDGGTTMDNSTSTDGGTSMDNSTSTDNSN